MRRKMQDNIIVGIVGVMFLLNAYLPMLFGIGPIIEELVVAGWIILVIGIIFVILSISTLRRKGVNRIAKSGIYCIVRHPMYVGGIVLFLSHIFFFQHWIIIINSFIAIVCVYMNIRLEDQRNIDKFGDDYKNYMKKVPRMNFLSGIIRILYRRRKN